MIICSDSSFTETFDNNEFLKLFKISTLQPRSKVVEEAKPFFFKQQALNEDENIKSDKDEPMDVDTTSQRLQASNILDNVYANVCKKRCLQQKYKLLLVTTMESYNSLLMTFKIF